MFKHVYIYITLQTYQKLRHIVRKSFCFERNHLLLEMLHLARKCMTIIIHWAFTSKHADT